VGQTPFVEGRGDPVGCLAVSRRTPMFGLSALCAVAALAGPVRADQAEQTETEALPVVELAGRVPERWLTDATDDFPLTPARWRRRMPPECRTRGGYRDHCQGPRLVPEPHGAAAERARRLALGQRATALVVMHQRPFDEWMQAVESLDADGSLTFPVPVGRLGRGFGRTRTGSLRHRRHFGVDIGADEGSEIVASRDGLVMYSDNELTGYGNVVILLHREGFSTFYAHCRRIHVFAGQWVRRGQPIAEVGMTGFARAPHLHFEWRQRGWPRDPTSRFRSRITGD